MGCKISRQRKFEADCTLSDDVLMLVDHSSTWSLHVAEAILSHRSFAYVEDDDNVTAALSTDEQDGLLFSRWESYTPTLRLDDLHQLVLDAMHSHGLRRFFVLGRLKLNEAAATASLSKLFAAGIETLAFVGNGETLFWLHPNVGRLRNVVSLLDHSVDISRCTCGAGLECEHFCPELVEVADEAISPHPSSPQATPSTVRHKRTGLADQEESQPTEPNRFQHSNRISPSYESRASTGWLGKE